MLYEEEPYPFHRGRREQVLHQQAGYITATCPPDTPESSLAKPGDVHIEGLVPSPSGSASTHPHLFQESRLYAFATSAMVLSMPSFWS